MNRFQLCQMCDAGDGACSNLREKDSFRFRLYVWMGLLVMTCFCLFGHHFVCYFSFVGLTHIDWVFCISLAFGLIMNGLWTLDFWTLWSFFMGRILEMLFPFHWIAEGGSVLYVETRESGD